MKHTDLIRRLCDDLEPTHKNKSLCVRVCGWTISMILFSVVAVLIIGTRGDIHTILSSPRFLLESVSILVAGISTGILALLLSSPGKKTQRYLLTVLGATSLWLISVGVAFFFQLGQNSIAEGFMLAGVGCSKKVIVLAVVPAFFLTALLRMGSAVSGKLAGALALVAAGLLGMFMLKFSCSQENPIHLVMYHLLPVVALGLLGWHLGGYLCGFEAQLRKKKAQILGDKKADKKTAQQA